MLAPSTGQCGVDLTLHRVWLLSLQVALADLKLMSKARTVLGILSFTHSDSGDCSMQDGNTDHSEKCLD